MEHLIVGTKSGFLVVNTQALPFLRTSFINENGGAPSDDEELTLWADEKASYYLGEPVNIVLSKGIE